MRWLSPVLLGAVAILLGACQTRTAKIVKVLPHYLDQKGQHTPAPSLYERDALQAHLRLHPDEATGLRFDVQWRSAAYFRTGLFLRLEMRGSRDPSIVTLEQEIEKPPRFTRWTSFDLDTETYKSLGDLVAWRVSLWDGELLLAEQTSFLW